MKINQLDKTCFKISTSSKKTRGKIDILIDPIYGSKCLKTKAQILLFTEKQEIIESQKEAFLIEGPGEYESKGIFIEGIGTLEKTDGEFKESKTIYVIKAEGIRLCYFGNIGQKDLTSEQLDRFGSIHVLMISTGMLLSPKEIQKIISQIEPIIVVLAQHDGQKEKKKQEELLKEMGAKEAEQQKEVVLKRTELKEDGTKIIVLRRSE